MAEGAYRIYFITLCFKGYYNLYWFHVIRELPDKIQDGILNVKLSAVAESSVKPLYSSTLMG